MKEEERLYYEGGLHNFYDAIMYDRVDIMGEHFRRRRIDLNKNVQFPSSHDDFYNLPLIEAIDCNSMNALKWLLEHGASMNAYCKEKKMTSYEYAKTITKSKTNRFTRIFDDFKNGFELNYKKESSKSIFKKSCGDDEDKKFKYEDNWFNFFNAIELDRTDVIEKHLKGLLDLKDSSYDPNCNFFLPIPPGFRQINYMIKAIRARSYNVLKLFLKRGGNPDTFCEIVWMTPLQYAEENDEKAYQIICDFKKSMN